MVSEVRQREAGRETHRAAGAARQGRGFQAVNGAEFRQAQRGVSKQAGEIMKDVSVRGVETMQAGAQASRGRGIQTEKQAT
jgi:hypothetical protein